jgi:hypothetical protein
MKLQLKNAFIILIENKPRNESPKAAYSNATKYSP